MAQTIAALYTADPRVRAVLVGGSVARGCADRYSDVEIGLFWEAFPTDEEFRAAMERARGTDWDASTILGSSGRSWTPHPADGP
jgi:hypothetical protein